MTDLISRADAIRQIKEEIQDFETNYMHGEDDEEYGHDIGFVAGLHRAKTFIRSLPSAEAEWIPCSERLPDDDGDYLVWLEDESDHYAVVYFDTGADAFGWWVDHYDPITLGFIESDFCEAKNITAWQPLPTPYKGGDDE